MKKIISLANPKSHISENYRAIRTGIEFSNLDKEIKIISVTSSQQNEGKTTVASNLAVTFASLEKRVLIIDGDLRNPSVHRMFGVSNMEGLVDLLIEQKPITNYIHTVEESSLHVLTSGKIPPNPSEILSSKKMKELVEGLKEHYDYIFIDTPPIGVITDAGIVSTYSDGCVFVVGSKEANVDMVKLAEERLEAVNANILGVVLNKYEPNARDEGYYNYYYRQDEEAPKGRRAKKKKKR